jgi:hypothetical protein
LASEVWVKIAHRQRVVQLDWVGRQYVEAIGSYYESSPGSVKRFPGSVADLIEDKRFVAMRRHLRQAYPNPLTGAMDWELIPAQNGGFLGIRGADRGDGAEGAREFRYVPAAQEAK